MTSWNVNLYRCAHCPKRVKRKSRKKWVRSYCVASGKIVHLQLVNRIPRGEKYEAKVLLHS